MPIVESRYSYEAAEKVLDKYVQDHPLQMFKLSWRRFKVMISALAVTEYPSTIPKELALSYVWEDVEMAFRARSEPFLGGFVMDLWHKVGRNRTSFLAAIKKAFQAADEATPYTAVRRFTVQDRRASFATSCEIYFEPVLPAHGYTLKAWAADNGESAEELENQYFDNAALERDLRLEESIQHQNETTKIRKKSNDPALLPNSSNKPFLRLVKTEDDK